MKSLVKISFLTVIAGITFFSCKKDKNDPKPEPNKPVITISTQPAATTTVTAGSISGSLSVTASVTEGATLSYQWYKNTSANNTGGTAESGATSTSFTIPTSLTAGTYYYFCEVKATNAETKRSNAATITVNAAGTPTPVITITAHPAATTTVTAGSISGNLSVTASVTEGATLSYQWYKNTSAVNTGGTAENGATNASFTIPTGLAAGTYYYFCEVSATGGATKVRTNVATVTVNAAGAPTPVITITTQPVAKITVYVGRITSILSVTASVTEGATLSYQWYCNIRTNSGDGTVVTGATSATFAIPTGLVEDVYYYYCEVSATGGAATVRSNVAEVVVWED